MGETEVIFIIEEVPTSQKQHREMSKINRDNKSKFNHHHFAFIILPTYVHPTQEDMLAYHFF